MAIMHTKRYAPGRSARFRAVSGLVTDWKEGIKHRGFSSKLQLTPAAVKASSCARHLRIVVRFL